MDEITTSAGDIVPDGPSEGLQIDEASRGLYEVGQWYWVAGKDGERLACIMEIGSNFVELHSPHQEKYGHSVWRIHLNEAHENLRPERNPESVIAGKVAHYKSEVKRLLGEVQSVTARLGVSNQGKLPGQASGTGTSLAVLSGQTDIQAYKTALIKAQDKELPDLFKEIEVANKKLAKWMSAEMMPMLAAMGGLEDNLKAVKNRIFNVTLYAGLTEEVVQVADGHPAEFTERLRVMQRRLYMDEEALLAYRTGGMEFKDIGEFDAWLCEPENRDRILPFPRCMVAMRVRRNMKERDGSLLQANIIMRLNNLDKLTFLYIRNGDQVFRMNCDLDFDEMIFPDKSVYQPGEPMMVKMYCGRVDRMITLREYEDLLLEQAKLGREYEINVESWKKENPGKDGRMAPYYCKTVISPREWEPFDHTNVYYDECISWVNDQITRYNRIAMIIQGLFDRSPVLHPHPPVKSWTPEGFAAAIELVYDGPPALYHGDPPDFDAYRAKCNEQIDENSVLYGQDDYWERQETERECKRLDNDWRSRSDYRPKHFRPYGNPGPGVLAKMESWQPRARKAVFAWNRERLTDGGWYSGKNRGDPIRTTLTVPVDELFNVSAYQPGDFKQFFRDPRTRAQYLKWAPMLISAEEYHAGNLKARNALKDGGEEVSVDEKPDTLSMRNGN